MYFNLDSEVIKENCKFDLYYNKTDITHTVLDGGNEIILANWPSDKHIICSVNNDIPIKIPSHLYALVNRSVLCNCSREAENHFLLESLAACHDSNSKLVMYFTVNTTFVSYLDHFDNLTDTLENLIIKNKTTFKQTLPISFNMLKFDADLLIAPRNLKDFIPQYNHKEEIFDLNERNDAIDLTTNKNSFLTIIYWMCSVCYCSNITTGYNFCNISIMQTQRNSEH